MQREIEGHKLNALPLKRKSDSDYNGTTLSRLSWSISIIMPVEGSEDSLSNEKRLEEADSEVLKELLFETCPWCSIYTSTNEFVQE